MPPAAAAAGGRVALVGGIPFAMPPARAAEVDASAQMQQYIQKYLSKTHHLT